MSAIAYPLPWYPTASQVNPDWRRLQDSSPIPDPRSSASIRGKFWFSDLGYVGDRLPLNQDSKALSAHHPRSRDNTPRISLNHCNEMSYVSIRNHESQAK